MKQFTEIHETLDRIKGNIPSRSFILFWLGAVPVFAIIIGLNLAVWLLT